MPTPVAQEVTSPITLGGSGKGTTTAQLRARTARAEVLADDVATGGSGPSLEPFTVELSYDAAPTQSGLVFAADTSDASGAIPSFAANVVMLGPLPGDPVRRPGDVP